MGSLSIWHWLVVIVVVMLLFGRGKISELMGDVAKGVKSFKKGLADDDDSVAKPIEHKTPEETQGELIGAGPVRANGRHKAAGGERLPMFDIGWSELVVIAVVAIVVIGPKDLPRAMRTVGQWTGKMKRMAREFQSQFNEAMREAELDDVKKDVEALAKINPMADLKKDLGKVESDVRASLAEPKPAAPATPALMTGPQPRPRRPRMVPPRCQRLRRGERRRARVHSAACARRARGIVRSGRREAGGGRRRRHAVSAEEDEVEASRAPLHRPPDRAARPPDPRDDRRAHRLRRLLLLRQADLQRAAHPLCLGGEQQARRSRSSSTRRRRNISSRR